MDENVSKVEEFSVCNEGSKAARYKNDPGTMNDVTQCAKIKIMNMENPMKIEYDIIGIDASMVNAMRRILIAEVPSMAIDKVHIYNNTSVMPDEVLAHRLGLITIKADSRLFEYKAPDDDEGTVEDTLQFEMKVKCTRKPNTPKDILPPYKQNCNHSRVYSGDLKFLPLGNQKELFGDIRPVCEDILINQLGPGHEIDLRAFCFKNNGREHAKFSPVVLATYRLLPQIRLLKEISGANAHTLAKCFPEGVIRIKSKKGKDVAKVVDSRNITCNRNVFLHEELKDSVEIAKVKDHYIFQVNSAGALPSAVLVLEAINIMKEKCRCFLSEMKSLKL